MWRPQRRSPRVRHRVPRASVSSLAVNADPQPATSVLCVVRDLAIGGVPRLYVDLCARLAARGVRATLCAGDGPVSAEARAAGVSHVVLDWTRGRRSAFDTVAGTAREMRADAALVLCDPLLVPLVPAALAEGGRVAIAVHSEAESLANEWFAPRQVDALREMVNALVATGSGRMVARGAAHAERVSALLGVSREELGILPPGVRIEELPFRPRERRGEDTVLALTRLSPEVASRLEAAVELVAGGLAAGRACRLRVVGDGPWRADAIELLRARLPDDAWEAEGLTDDPYGAILSADVVVASNLSSLEAAALGRPVVGVRRYAVDGNALGPLITPATFPLLSGDIFGTSLPAADPAEVWRALDSVDAGMLAEVRGSVERCNSAEAQMESVLAILSGLAPAPRNGLVAALGRATAQALDDEEEARATADELWRARNWYESQLAQREGTPRAGRGRARCAGCCGGRAGRELADLQAERVLGAVGNHPRQRQRRRGSGGRRVANVNRALGLGDHEVVNERAVAGERLCADAAECRQHVARVRARARSAPPRARTPGGSPPSGSRRSRCATSAAPCARCPAMRAWRRGRAAATARSGRRRARPRAARSARAARHPTCAS